LIAALGLIAVVAARTNVTDRAPTVDVAGSQSVPLTSDASFPLGWYDSLEARGGVFDIAKQGMNVVLPYHTEAGDEHAYLDAAQVAGLKVVLEIDRKLVKAESSADVRQYVSRYKSHPALYGWYLADEPSINSDLGPASPEVAGELYRVIKDEDPKSPVAVAFAKTEQAEDFRQAMDVMLFDDYPCREGKPEFDGFEDWWGRLQDQAAVGAEEGGFIPVLQAFGENAQGEPQFGRRLPTPAEQRYMVFSSVQAGATGLLFWTRYRASREWIDRVLQPIVSEFREFVPAFGAGMIRDRAAADGEGIEVSLHRDPLMQRYVLVVVHHGDGRVPARIAIDRTLGLQQALTSGDVEEKHDVTDGVLEHTFGPYEAKVYELS
jgi:hypothetical protein